MTGFDDDQIMKNNPGSAIVLGLAAAVLLAGCTQRTLTPNPNFAKQLDQRPLKYSNRTIVFYEPSHGTQIEYFAPDGGAFLWYPGKSRVVAGKYKLDGNKICFQYGKNTYNPVTRQAGGNWKCSPSFVHRYSGKKACSGDPFNLKTGNIPFRLKKESYLSAEIKSQCDGDL